jgi:hypothetical protein
MEQQLKEVECNLREIKIKHAQETGELQSAHKHQLLQQKLKHEKTIDQIRFSREEAANETQERLKKIYEGYHSREHADNKAELLSVILGVIISVVFTAYFLFGVRLIIKSD